ASPQGVSGTSPGLRSEARFNRYLNGSGIQNPEKSGLPSAVFTVGAFMSTLPSGVRGTFLFLNGSHWAWAVAVLAQAATKATRSTRETERRLMVMGLPLWTTNSKPFLFDMANGNNVVSFW